MEYLGATIAYIGLSFAAHHWGTLPAEKRKDLQGRISECAAFALFMLAIYGLSNFVELTEISWITISYLLALSPVHFVSYFLMNRWFKAHPLPEFEKPHKRVKSSLN